MADMVVIDWCDLPMITSTNAEPPFQVYLLSAFEYA
jgi:hypothetical protein